MRFLAVVNVLGQLALAAMGAAVIGTALLLIGATLIPGLLSFLR
jgi:hypothetical protein